MDRLMNSVPGRVVRKLMEDQAPNWAIIIAWNGLFAAFPIVVFGAAVLGFLVAHGVALDFFYNKLVHLSPDPTVQSAFADALNHFQQQQGILLVVGVVGLLWGGSALFGAMEQAFAVIYHTKPREFLPQKLMSIGMIIVFLVTAVPVVTSSSILPALRSIPGMPAWLTEGAAALVLQFLLGVVGGVILFSAIYFVVPNRKQELRKVWPGGLVAAVLFELITLLFPLYVSLTKSVATYGKTFGLFFVLLTFFLFLGYITMMGVEVNSVIYPVDVEQPARGQTVTAAPKTAKDADRRGAPTVEPTADGRVAANGRHGVPARAALGMAVVASVVGVILGRRSASGN